MNCSRRRWLETFSKAIGGIALAPVARATDFGLGIDRLSDAPAAWTRTRSRAYRADAVVTVFGVPIFSRRGVGRAVASVRERAAAAGNTIALWFAGGSDPQRAHGLRYAGSTQEISLANGAELTAAATFGFVTASSSEETLEEARRRVAGFEHEQHSVVVVDEEHRAGGVRVRRALVPAPELRPSGFRPMIRQVRSMFASAAATDREVAVAAPGVPATFLYSMLIAGRSAERKSTHEYVHAGKRYQLLYERTPDPHAGAALAAKNVTSAAVLRITGQIRDSETRSSTMFRMWTEEGADLPLRIEFSPRSYLRISLELDPQMKNAADTEEAA